MSLDQLIPTIFNDNWQKWLETALVFGSEEIVNTEYEGGISDKGDKVNVIYEPDMELFDDYDEDTDISDPKYLDPAKTEIVINKSPYLHFGLKGKEIIQVQNNPKLVAAASKRGIYKIKKHLDTSLSSLYPEAGLRLDGNTDSAPIEITASNAYDKLDDMAVLFDELDIPEEGRFAILPPFFYGCLEKDDRFIKYTSEGQKVLRNRFRGHAANFDCYKSNQVATSGDNYYPIFGVKKQSFARAIQKKINLESYKPEKRIDEIRFKGKTLYGVKMIRPDLTGTMVITK